MLDAKVAIADAKRLHNVAEIKKLEARAARRRYSALLKMENGGHLQVNVTTRTVQQIPVTVKPSPHTQKIAATVVKEKPKTRRELIEIIQKQPWFYEVRKNNVRDVTNFIHSLDDKRLKFFAKRGNLIQGNFYYKSGASFYQAGNIFINLERQDLRSKALGYPKTDIRVFLHETGHLMDDVFKIHEHLPELESKLRNDFLIYVDNLLGTEKRFNGPMLRDEFRGIYKSLDNYHLFTEQEKQIIKANIEGSVGSDSLYLRNGVSDLIGGLTKHDIHAGYGHPNTYWNRGDNPLIDEAIAHLFEAYMNGGEKYKNFVKFFPETMKYFEEYFEKLM